MTTKEIDWQAGRKLQECNRYMLTNELLCDIDFKVRPEEELIHAHKYVLASRSSVFYAMLFGSLADRTGIISIPDIEPHVFRILLKFLYCEDVEVDHNTVTATMYAANKYAVPDLIEECKHYLEQNISTETVLVILDSAKFYNFTGLSDKCMEFILQNSENSKAVLSSSHLPDLKCETFAEILKSDVLCVDELEVYNNVVRWGQEQCRKIGKQISDENIRELIKDLLVYVRFPVMDIETFVKKVSTGNVLPVEDKMEIVQGILGVKTDTKYSRARRKPVCIRLHRGSVDRNATSWQHKGEKDAIQFSVNKCVNVHGFIMFGCVASPYTAGGKSDERF